MRNVAIACTVAGLAFTTAAQAEMAAPPTPAPSPQYGQPGVNLDQATKAVEAAVAEAKKNGWLMAVAVVSNSGSLVHFSRMDGTAFGSIRVAQEKAKAAATFQRPTKSFEDRVSAGGAGLVLLTVPGVIASSGGIPLMRDGKIIGAIGCSGATSAQDTQACQAGADTIK
ncbi:MAG TPA: heme-binding protein [Sphingomicrobium sp.]|nr:heme-binding protein [Sphingomicrobium sp.]